MRLVIPAGVDEHRSAGAKRASGVLVRCGDRPVTAHEAEPWPRHHEVVRELVERPIGAAVRAERKREHECVRRHVPPGMVPTNSTGPCSGT